MERKLVTAGLLAGVGVRVEGNAVSLPRNLKIYENKNI